MKARSMPRPFEQETMDGSKREEKRNRQHNILPSTNGDLRKYSRVSSVGVLPRRESSGFEG
jgi:hypothetical protein